MGYPQYIWIALMALSLLASAHLHGKPKTDKNNFFTSFVHVGLVTALLYWGGFFGGCHG